MWFTEQYKNALALQRLIAKQAANEEQTLRDRCLAARALAELEEMKRKIRMKPLPKAIDVQPKRKPVSEITLEPEE